MFLASLDAGHAPALWEAARRTLWQGALVRAHQSGVAVYDTLFVELAARQQMPLATFDAALVRAFPNIAARPGSLLHL